MFNYIVLSFSIEKQPDHLKNPKMFIFLNFKIQIFDLNEVEKIVIHAEKSNPRTNSNPESGKVEIIVTQGYYFLKCGTSSAAGDIDYEGVVTNEKTIGGYSFVLLIFVTVGMIIL
jgi:hypothetical protein